MNTGTSQNQVYFSDDTHQKHFYPLYRLFPSYFATHSKRYPWTPGIYSDEQAAKSDVLAHDTEGKLTFIRASLPRAILTEEIPALIDDFRNTFKNAGKAVFDGIELHVANSGYLLDQFTNSVLNTRNQYGGATL